MTRRPRWIDYRTTLDTGATLHLHVVARGDYDTGVFAYNLIRRGQRTDSDRRQPQVAARPEHPAIYDK